jgi:acyl-CoA synthetase (NDP forming)
VLESDEVDAVVVMYIPRLPGTSPPIAQVIAELTEEIGGKTVVAVFLDPDGSPAELRAGKVAVPSLPLPESAARALARAVEYGKLRDRPRETIAQFSDVDLIGARGTVERAAARLGESGGWLLPDETHSLLRAFGIRVPNWALAGSRQEAVAAAERIGYPLVAKVMSPSVVHKSDVGAVALGIASASRLEEVYLGLMQRFPDATGVLVQQQIERGHELFVGLHRDAACGALLACGLGGTDVEALGGVQFRLQPISRYDAAAMLHDSPLGRILETSRGSRTFDEQAAIDLLLRISAMIDAVPEIEEADWNPVCVFAPGQGVTAVDVRIRVA